MQKSIGVAFLLLIGSALVVPAVQAKELGGPYDHRCETDGADSGCNMWDESAPCHVYVYGSFVYRPVTPSSWMPNEFYDSGLCVWLPAAPVGNE